MQRHKIHTRTVAIAPVLPIVATLASDIYLLLLDCPQYHGISIINQIKLYFNAWWGFMYIVPYLFQNPQIVKGLSCVTSLQMTRFDNFLVLPSSYMCLCQIEGRGQLRFLTHELSKSKPQYSS